MSGHARKAGITHGITIPTTNKQAVAYQVHGQKWRDSIQSEIQTLIKLGTWKVVDKEIATSQSKSIMSTKWVLHVKLGGDGRIEKFKARLVARGFEQREGSEFEETFAPAFRMESLRILFAIAAFHGMVVHVVDAVSAFVGSDLDKTIFIELFDGIEDFGPSAERGRSVLELMKSLYGLRQSANLWHAKIKNFLEKIGFATSTADSSVFLNFRGIIIALYVDDMLISGPSDQDVRTVKDKLRNFHPMKDLGRAEKILGFRITWKSHGEELDQENYVERILGEFGMLECKPHGTLLLLDLTSDWMTICHRSRTQNMLLFRRIMGRVMFFATSTRPDLIIATNRLSQYLASPKKVPLAAAKHILRYLRKTSNYRLRYSQQNDVKLIGYADAGYGNASNHRSTSPSKLLIGCAPVTWSSRKQSITAQSTTEAEYVALAEAAKQSIWIRHFIFSISKSTKLTYSRKKSNRTTTLIYEDNQGAIKLADTSTTNHSKTTHTDPLPCHSRCHQQW